MAVDDVLILGAGPAGLMCALRAAGRGRVVRLIDKSVRVGGKLPLAGGGRCNFTNRNVSVENFISGNPNFCRSALARFGPDDIVAMLDSHGIEYEQREHGRLFCRYSGKQIVGLFEELCRDAGVTATLGAKIESVQRRGGDFEVATSKGRFRGRSLVVACGGASYPQAGASELGYRISRQFDLALIEARAGLVPLLFKGGDRKLLGKLSGASLPAEVRCGGKVFCEEVLFTHRGLSGPAILQISNYIGGGDPVVIDWLPGVDVFELLWRCKESRGAASLGKLLGALPRAMSKVFVQEYFGEMLLAQASRGQIEALSRAVNSWRFDCAGTEGLTKAETTLGGVDTGALSSQTMEAVSVQRLYFVGEVVDVAGQLGGYNLHWAWASGAAAGDAV